MVINGKITSVTLPLGLVSRRQKQTSVVVSSPPTAEMKDPAEVDAVVLQYLRKKGYTQAEAALKREAKDVQTATMEDFAARMRAEADASVTNYILFYNPEENARSKYDETFGKFREWVHSSLDIYKHELLALLYPVFVHSYLDLVAKGFTDEARKFMDKYKKDHETFHSSEMQRLSAVTTPQLLQENELAKVFRLHRFNVRLCQYSFELMVNFLHENKFMLLLSIVNQYLHLKVYNGQPDPRIQDENTAITGTAEADITQLHKKEVAWGLLEGAIVTAADATAREKELKEMRELASSSASVAAAGGAAAPSLSTSTKGADEGSTSTSAPDPKKAAAAKAAAAKPAAGPDGKKSLAAFLEGPRIKSKVPLPRLPDSVEQAQLEDIKTRVALSAAALPSIAFYTFLNTHSNLCTSAVTTDGSQVVGGFADSTLRLWDLKRAERDSQRNPQYPVQPRVSTNQIRSDDYAALIGHAGPVYGASFSPDQQYLLSCSEDCTVRLWSIEMLSNLVAYRGHNFPVWDVEFSPMGYYFASASHDRTARLWSTDRVFPLRIFAGHLSDVDVVKFHPNCNYLATGSSDKSIRLWDLTSGECVRIFTGHFGAVYSLAFSPDGRVLASAGEDKSIHLWDIASGQRLKTLNGHTKTVWSLDFSAEGALLASGSADQTVRLWDAYKARGIAAPEDELEVPAPAPSAAASAAAPLGSPASGVAPSPAPAATPADQKKRPRDEDLLIQTYPTKQTPVFSVQFTPRNLLLGVGPFSTSHSSLQLPSIVETGH